MGKMGQSDFKELTFSDALKCMLRAGEQEQINFNYKIFFSLYKMLVPGFLMKAFFSNWTRVVQDIWEFYKQNAPKDFPVTVFLEWIQIRILWTEFECLDQETKTENYEPSDYKDFIEKHKFWLDDCNDVLMFLCIEIYEKTFGFYRLPLQWSL